MKKIPSLFRRDFRQVFDEVVPGSEWVLRGEGRATEKFDGTACRVFDGLLWKRYARKRNKKTGEHKPAPEGWIGCEPEPDQHTGHWPGWVPINDGPDDRWHREAWERGPYKDNTFELVGPKVQGNPYGLHSHQLWAHGDVIDLDTLEGLCPDFDSIQAYLEARVIEGIVWHHPDGRMVKIKRKDFGFQWLRGRDSR